MFGGGNRVEAIQADVAFNVDLGQFRGDMGHVGRIYEQTTGGMSTDALRLSVAQEKVARAIKRTGPDSISTKQATLGLRREMDSLASSSAKVERGIDRDTRSIDRFGRGALAGSGAVRGFGNSLAFASSAFLGGAGLTYAIKTSVDAASNLAEQTSKTRVVFEGSAAEIEAWSKTTATGLGLASDKALEAASTYGLLFRNIGSGTQDAARLSKSLVQLGGDLASFNNTSVEDALAAIRSGLTGEIEPLRRYGVFLSEARTRTQALADTGKTSAASLTTQDKVLARYKLLLEDTTRAQGDYIRTADGQANSQRTVTALIRETEIAIGTALLPSVNDITRATRDWLGDQENQERIQREVNEAVETGAKVARGLADGLDLISEAAEPVIDALGGIENAAQLALIVGIVLKARKAATSFGMIAGASAVTRTKVVADAVAMGAALDIATRPRVVPVTVVERIGQYGAPIPAAGAPAGRGGSKIPYAIGFNGPTAVAAAVISADGDSFRPQAYDPKKYPNVARLLAKIEAGGALTDAERAALREFGDKSISQLSSSQLQRLNANLVGQATGLGGDRNRPNQGRKVDQRTQPPKDPPGSKVEPFNADLSATMRGRAIQLGLLSAGDTAGQSDDVAANRAAAAYYRAGLDTVEEGTKEYNTILAQYVSFHRAELAAVDQINQERERQRQELQARREADAEKKKAAILKAAELYRDRLDVKEQRLENAQERAELTDRLTDDRKTTQALIAFYKAESEDKALRMAERLAYDKKGIEAQKKLKTLAPADPKADFAKLSFGFLQELRGLTNQFASNVTQGTVPRVEKIEITNQFPHPPTKDSHVEAIYMRHNIERVMQMGY